MPLLFWLMICNLYHADKQLSRTISISYGEKKADSEKEEDQNEGYIALWVMWILFYPVTLNSGSNFDLISSVPDLTSHA